MSENPLHCDCSLANSLKAGKNIQLVGNEAQCASPDEFRNTPLATVLPHLCQEEPEGPDLPSKGGRPIKTKEFDQGTDFAPQEPPPEEVPHEEQPTIPSEPPTESTTESDIVTLPEYGITEEFASELTEKPTTPPSVDEGDD